MWAGIRIWFFVDKLANQVQDDSHGSKYRYTSDRSNYFPVDITVVFNKITCI